MTDLIPTTDQLREMYVAHRRTEGSLFRSADLEFQAWLDRTARTELVENYGQCALLPAGTVILDAQGDVLQVAAIGEQIGVKMTGERGVFSLNWVVYPATVLHRG